MLTTVDLRSYVTLCFVCLALLSYSASAVSATVSDTSFTLTGQADVNGLQDTLNDTSTGDSITGSICANDSGIPGSCPTSGSAAANLESSVTTSQDSIAFIAEGSISGDSNMDIFVAGASASGDNAFTFDLDEAAYYRLEATLTANCTSPIGFENVSGASISAPNFSSLSVDVDCNNTSATVNQEGTLSAEVGQDPGHRIQISGFSTTIEPTGSGNFSATYKLVIFLNEDTNVPLPTWAMYSLASLLLVVGLLFRSKKSRIRMV